MRKKLELNEKVSIEVSSKVKWNASGIFVNKDEEYLFSASGNWWDMFFRTDAEGFNNWYMRLHDKKKRMPEYNWFALIGSIEQLSDFYIGKSSRIKMDREGELFFYANDMQGFYWNNIGQINLDIERLK